MKDNAMLQLTTSTITAQEVVRYCCPVLVAASQVWAAGGSLRFNLLGLLFMLVLS
jgi:hypothetical protein